MSGRDMRQCMTSENALSSVPYVTSRQLCMLRPLRKSRFHCKQRVWKRKEGGGGGREKMNGEKQNGEEGGVVLKKKNTMQQPPHETRMKGTKKKMPHATHRLSKYAIM